MPRLTYLPNVDHAAFICGCGHSGTTLLATILSVHHKLYVPLYESEAFLGQQMKMAERLGQLDAEALSARKKYLVEKTPRHIRKMRSIRKNVPGARFVCMVRDGRDVTASIGIRYEGDFESGFKRWVADTGLVLAERDAPDVLVVRYEDLIGDLSHVLSAICTFLGIAYTPDLLRYYEKPALWHGLTEVRRSNGVGEEHKDLRNWQVNNPIFNGSGRWRSDLPPEFVERFETSEAADLMRAFGYEIGLPENGQPDESKAARRSLS